MSEKKLQVIFFLCVTILFSCAGNNNTVIIPVPPSEYFIQEEKIIIEIDNITETKDGASAENMPVWLSAFIYGGIEEVERINAYYGKYVFIGINEGINLGALKIWADKFSIVQDFTMLSADRIQRRMISGTSLYPDDEYGDFFEAMIKKAYSAVYHDAVKEDTYWIKLKINDESENGENIPEFGGIPAPSHNYNYFVLVMIDKMAMQAVISKMMEEVYSSVTPVDYQRNSIIRLRRTFFEGF